MPFVQDAAPTTEAATVAQDTTPSVPVDSSTVGPQKTPNIAPSTEVVPEAKPSVAAEPKSETNPVVKPEATAEANAPIVTVTKLGTTTTPLAPKDPSDAIWLFTWLPLLVMMGLWLYLRGRNQAAQRARADALLAASSKKSKKPARVEAGGDSDSAAVSQFAGERISKGNSKKNKKDKQQQKKKQQQANSDAATSKAKAIAASATPIGSSAINAPEFAKPISPRAAVRSAPTAQSTTTTPTAAERKMTAPAVQPAKAIFEPLRKVTASVRTENTAEVEGDESDDQDYAPVRNRRPSPPPPAVTTSAKVSSGRFEKLNLPPANAGLGASSVNRWPAEAARPVATVRAPQQNTPRSDLTTAHSGNEESTTPSTARGLGAFVKLAKPTVTADSTIMESVESANEPSGS